MLSGEEERAEMAQEKRAQVEQTKNVSPSAVLSTITCSCGAELPIGAKFCSECGAKIEAKKGCPKCGFADAKGKFCSECGASL